MNADKGFFGRLFDISFSHFITTTLVKIAFVICVIFAAFVALVAIIAGFNQSVGLGILGLIFSPAIFILVVALSRVYLEAIVLVFRIAEYVREIAERGRLAP